MRLALALVAAVALGPVVSAADVVLVGPLELVVVDPVIGKGTLPAPILSAAIVQPDGSKVPLVLPPTLLEEKDLRHGQTVLVEGELVPDAGVVVVTAIVPLSTVPDIRQGVQETLVILINFVTNPVQPFTLARADAELLKVDAFMRENSYGLTSVAATVIGWATLATPASSPCQTNTWANLADQWAREHGVDPAGYRRHVYAFAGAGKGGCGWSGLGSLGGDPSRAWIDATGGLGSVVVEHELGHNLGLLHSHGLACSTSGGCVVSEYGDGRDVMGSGPGHYNGFQKERLGWLEASLVQTVTTSGQYAIGPYEQLPAGLPKILKIAGTSIYLESRIGSAAVGKVAAGSPAVLVHVTGPYLIDLDPLTTTNDIVLDVGQTYTVGAVTVRTVAANAQGAVLAITMP
jgi:hypothetical protein